MIALLPLLLVATLAQTISPPQGSTAAAVSYDFLGSTTQDCRLPRDPVSTDSAVLHLPASSDAAQVLLSQEAWRTLAGDRDQDGFLDGLPGLDALCFIPQRASHPVAHRLAFSVERSEFGLIDGDILALSTTGPGVDVLLSEATLYSVLQPTTGYIDIDALAWPTPDELWFSVRDTLKGTLLADILDGDVLAYTFSTGTCRVLWRENEIQAMVDAATGLTQSIGDVTGLTLDAQKRMLFTVQSPSSKDSAVFSELGQLLVAEAEWGFLQSAEIDAIARIPFSLEPTPVTSMGSPSVKPGYPVQIRVRNATPGGMVMGFNGLQIGRATAVGQYGGIGAIYLMPDLAPHTVRPLHLHPTLADGGGSASFSWMLPIGALYPPGVYVFVQSLDFETGRLTAPVGVRVE